MGNFATRSTNRRNQRIIFIYLTKSKTLILFILQNQKAIVYFNKILQKINDAKRMELKELERKRSVQKY